MSTEVRPLTPLLSPRLLAAHYPYHLMLLGSPPDMVHEGQLRKARSLNTNYVMTAATAQTLKNGVHLCYSGFQIQGAATAPTGVTLLHTARNNLFSLSLWVVSPQHR